MWLGEKLATGRAKLIVAGAVQLCIVAAFCALGAYIHFSDKIFPNISVDGVNVSGLSRESAMLTLNIQNRELRAGTAKVTIIFPDSSEFHINGRDVGFGHDLHHVVRSAYFHGRGNGFIMDTVAFLRRLGGEVENYGITFDLDEDILLSRASGFTRNYNAELDVSLPRIYDDRIVMVKGAGHVRASESEVYTLALEGLYESFETGRIVVITYTLPESNADVEELLAIHRRLRSFPVSATYDPETRTITESTIGTGFDYADAAALLNSTESGTKVTIDLIHKQPEVSKDYLESFLFRDLIGETVTRISGTEDRLTNITLASMAIDGHMLEPGEEFSFNQVVGRRTEARGYRPGPMISSGQVVMGIGGGICQVSSSIYNAIMDSDIRITERRAHTLPVDYLPRGRDATVSWGSIDFRFVNNTEHPMRIDASVDGRTLSLQVYGTIGGMQE